MTDSAFLTHKSICSKSRFYPSSKILHEQRSQPTWHFPCLPVTCLLSPVTDDSSLSHRPSPSYSPNMHSRIVLLPSRPLGLGGVLLAVHENSGAIFFMILIIIPNIIVKVIFLNLKIICLILLQMTHLRVLNMTEILESLICKLFVLISLFKYCKTKW